MKLTPDDETLDAMQEGAPAGGWPTVELEDQWELGDAVDEACPDGVLSWEALEGVANTHDAPLSHVLVGASMDPDYTWPQSEAARVEVCTGSCQLRGGLSVLEALLSERASRKAEGRPSFDISTVACLDACDHGPALTSDGPQGGHTHRRVRSEQVPELIEAICDPAA